MDFSLILPPSRVLVLSLGCVEYFMFSVWIAADAKSQGTFRMKWYSCVVPRRRFEPTWFYCRVIVCVNRLSLRDKTKKYYKETFKNMAAVGHRRNWLATFRFHGLPSLRCKPPDWQRQCYFVNAFRLPLRRCTSLVPSLNHSRSFRPAETQ